MTWRRMNLRELASGLMLSWSVATMKGSEEPYDEELLIAFAFVQTPGAAISTGAPRRSYGESLRNVHCRLFENKILTDRLL